MTEKEGTSGGRSGRRFLQRKCTTSLSSSLVPLCSPLFCTHQSDSLRARASGYLSCHAIFSQTQVLPALPSKTREARPPALQLLAPSRRWLIARFSSTNLDEWSDFAVLLQLLNHPLTCLPRTRMPKSGHLSVDFVDSIFFFFPFVFALRFCQFILCRTTLVCPPLFLFCSFVLSRLPVPSFSIYRQRCSFRFLFSRVARPQRSFWPLVEGPPHRSFPLVSLSRV